MWIRKTPYRHDCRPPLRDRTIVPGIYQVADSGSTMDLWRCDNCDGYWHPARTAVRRNYRWVRANKLNLQVRLAWIAFENREYKPMMRKLLAAAVATVVAVTVAATPAAAAPVTFISHVTGYSWFDNTPPGSAEISHPVIHRRAGGVGTYADPITVAVGHSIINGKDILDFPAGTVFYVSGLKRYFIVEDTCGDGRRPQNGPCHRLDTPGNRAPAGAQAWLDIWVGGRAISEAQANRCMNKITKLYTVIKNPPQGLATTPGDIARAGC